MIAVIFFFFFYFLGVKSVGKFKKGYHTVENGAQEFGAAHRRSRKCLVSFSVSVIYYKNIGSIMPPEYRTL